MEWGVSFPPYRLTGGHPPFPATGSSAEGRSPHGSLLQQSKHVRSARECGCAQRQSNFGHHITFAMLYSLEMNYQSHFKCNRRALHRVEDRDHGKPFQKLFTMTFWGEAYQNLGVEILNSIGKG